MVAVITPITSPRQPTSSLVTARSVVGEGGRRDVSSRDRDGRGEEGGQVGLAGGRYLLSPALCY
jgi:hypothetical protein